jgi:hypothetical protein
MTYYRSEEKIKSHIKKAREILEKTTDETHRAKILSVIQFAENKENTTESRYKCIKHIVKHEHKHKTNPEEDDLLVN